MVYAAIRHQQPEETPYALGFEGDTEALLDEYYGGQAWKLRLKRYFTTVAAVDTDLKRTIDDTHNQDAYGGIWRTDRLPWHLEKPPLERPSFEGYAFPTPETFYRPDWKEDGFKTCAENRGERFVIGSLGWGLFERSWNLRGFTTILTDSVENPAFFEEVLDRILTLYLDFVDYTCDLPVDAILFGDDWGDQRGIILGPKRWRKFLKPRWAQIYAAVHRHGKIVMHHSCGSVADIIPDLIEIGVDVMESVQPEAAGMNPYELKRKWGQQITFMGCLGSQSTIPFGTPEQIQAEVRRLRTEMGRGGGYILSPAKPLQTGTPILNAAAVFEAFAEGG
jgi:uroporphyrinogen decarboxylase